MTKQLDIGTRVQFLPAIDECEICATSGELGTVTDAECQGMYWVKPDNWSTSIFVEHSVDFIVQTQETSE